MRLDYESNFILKISKLPGKCYEVPRSETTEFFFEVRLTREHRGIGIDAKALVYTTCIRRIG